MKKTISTFILALALTGSANAQIVRDQFSFDNHGLMTSVPAEFAYGNSSKLFLYEDGYSDHQDEYKLKVNVYDENLELTKSFLIKDLTFDYQLEYKSEEREIKSVDSTCVGSSYCGSYNDFINQLKWTDPRFTEDDLIIENLENGDRKITLDYTKSYSGNLNSLYFHYDYFGDKYPRYNYIEHDGNVTRYTFNYNISYTDWVDKGTIVKNFSQDLTPIYLTNVNLNKNGYSKYQFWVTQTLFNNDENYEYLVPKIRLSKHGNWDNGPSIISPSTPDDPIETQKDTLISEESEFELVGFQIVSENGTAIKDINFEAVDGYVNTDNAYVLTMGNNTYLVFSGRTGSGKDCTIFYKIDRNTTSIQQVKNVNALMKVFPSIVNKGSNINVEFGDGATEASEVSVYSTTGAKIKNIHVPANQKSAQFNINAPSGMYIVGRSQKGKATETKKIIIK